MAAFPEIQKIPFEGPKSKNLLAFQHYNENELVEGKSMRDHLRFSVAYWHTFRGTGSDPFGPGTMQRPWEAAKDSVESDYLVTLSRRVWAANSELKSEYAQEQAWQSRAN